MSEAFSSLQMQFHHQAALVVEDGSGELPGALLSLGRLTPTMFPVLEHWLHLGVRPTKDRIIPFLAEFWCLLTASFSALPSLPALSLFPPADQPITKTSPGPSGC